MGNSAVAGKLLFYLCLHCRRVLWGLRATPTPGQLTSKLDGVRASKV